jgi:hypothetical protein
MIADGLNQKLYARTDPSTMATSGLFKGSDVAPRLRGARVRLEQAMTRDKVGHLLESRPTEGDLVKTGIVSGGVSSRLAGVQRQLQHNMTVDRVGHLLEKRSEVGDLQHANILKDVRVAPALQGTQRALERNLARANLYHALKHRPTVTELQERGVYVPVEPYQDHTEDEPYYEVEEKSAPVAREAKTRESKAPVSGEGSSGAAAAAAAGYQRRSKNFHLTRILLKFVANMAESGEISLQQKGYLKDLIVDQDKTILAVAEAFDAENEVADFKDSLVMLASRK